MQQRNPIEKIYQRLIETFQRLTELQVPVRTAAKDQLQRIEESRAIPEGPLLFALSAILAAIWLLYHGRNFWHEIIRAWPPQALNGFYFFVATSLALTRKYLFKALLKLPLFKKKTPAFILLLTCLSTLLLTRSTHFVLDESQDKAEVVMDGEKYYLDSTTRVRSIRKFPTTPFLSVFPETIQLEPHWKYLPITKSPLELRNLYKIPGDFTRRDTWALELILDLELAQTLPMCRPLNEATYRASLLYEDELLADEVLMAGPILIGNSLENIKEILEFDPKRRGRYETLLRNHFDDRVDLAELLDVFMTCNTILIAPGELSKGKFQVILSIDGKEVIRSEVTAPSRNHFYTLPLSVPSKPSNGYH